MAGGNTDDLTKKERNDLKREEKQREYRKSSRIKKIKKWSFRIFWVGIAICGLYWVMNAAQTANENRPGKAVPIMNRDHINVGDYDGVYNSNPPTSGPHAGPAPWGFSSEEILDENAIHNIEHGGIWISYKDLDNDSIERLRNIAQENSLSVVVSPRDRNSTKVAVVSWGRLMEFDSVDGELIADFIKSNKNKSPEPLAR